ncbi:MAG: GNAT family N-acetyltransferase [Ferruginibacter sp.]
MRKVDINVKVNTSRLKLRPVSDKYKIDICNEFTAEITKFMPFNPTGDIKMTEEFIENSRQELLEGASIHFCILKKETNEFLGCCGIHGINTGALEIGLWLKKKEQAKGYGTETVGALINYAEEKFDFAYIVYPVDQNNLASKKIPEKFGFLPFSVYKKKKNETENLTIIEYRKNKHSS